MKRTLAPRPRPRRVDRSPPATVSRRRSPPTSTSSPAPARRSSPSRDSATCSATPRSACRSTRTSPRSSRATSGCPISCSAPPPRAVTRSPTPKAIDEAASRHDRAARSSRSSWSTSPPTMPSDTGSQAATRRGANDLLRRAPHPVPRAQGRDAGREGFDPQKAEAIRAQVTPANFADMAKKLQRRQLQGQRWRSRRVPARHDGQAVRRRGRGAQARRDLARRRDAVRLPHRPAQHLGPDQGPVRAAGRRPHAVRSPRAPTSPQAQTVSEGAGQGQRRRRR